MEQPLHAGGVLPLDPSPHLHPTHKFMTCRGTQCEALVHLHHDCALFNAQMYVGHLILHMLERRLLSVTGNAASVGHAGTVQQHVAKTLQLTQLVHKPLPHNAAVRIDVEV